MLQIDLSASVRGEFGKGAMHRLRNDGKTPAILYGQGTDPIALQLETKILYQELLNLQRRNVVVTLSLDDGATHHVIVKDVQTDPVRDSLIHADFQKIDIEKAKQFVVPVEFVGSAKGIDLGGMLVIERNTVVLEGVPLDIPDSCQIDVSELVIGDQIMFDALELPENVVMISDKDQVCVKVNVLSQERTEDDLEEEAEAETETAAEAE